MRQAVAAPAEGTSFSRLVAERNRFTLTMSVIFLLAYFALPVLAGYAKPLMASKIYGNVTFGYLLAFLEFILGWVLAAIYVRKARSFDRLAEEARS